MLDGERVNGVLEQKLPHARGDRREPLPQRSRSLRADDSVSNMAKPTAVKTLDDAVPGDTGSRINSDYVHLFCPVGIFWIVSVLKRGRLQTRRNFASLIKPNHVRIHCSSVHL